MCRKLKLQYQAYLSQLSLPVATHSSSASSWIGWFNKVIHWLFTHCCYKTHRKGDFSEEGLILAQSSSGIESIMVWNTWLQVGEHGVRSWRLSSHILRKPSKRKAGLCSTASSLPWWSTSSSEAVLSKSSMSSIASLPTRDQITKHIKIWGRHFRNAQRCFWSLLFLILVPLVVTQS